MDGEIMKEPLLSILTPAVPSRLFNGRLGSLVTEIQGQIESTVYPVEHLILIDNKMRSVGQKRDALLRAARGKYVAFLDDDDWITEAYVERICSACDDNPDVVTFRQTSYINTEKGDVEFRLGNPNEQWKPNQITKRNAWHVCAWRRDIAVLSHFPDSNYGEDRAFVEPLWTLPGLKEIHIPEVLHFYRHSSDTTEAPAP